LAARDLLKFIGLKSSTGAPSGGICLKKRMDIGSQADGAAGS
jgi:hypothetical protein